MSRVYPEQKDSSWMIPCMGIFILLFIGAVWVFDIEEFRLFLRDILRFLDH